MPSDELEKLALRAAKVLDQFERLAVGQDSLTELVREVPQADLRPFRSYDKLLKMPILDVHGYFYQVAIPTLIRAVRDELEIQQAAGRQLENWISAFRGLTLVSNFQAATHNNQTTVAALRALNSYLAQLNDFIARQASAEPQKRAGRAKRFKYDRGHLGKALAEARRSVSWSGPLLASHIGGACDKNLIYKWETGKSHPSDLYLSKVEHFIREHHPRHDAALTAALADVE